MFKLIITFAIGWLACIAVAGFRNGVNKPPVEIYTKSGKRVR